MGYNIDIGKMLVKTLDIFMQPYYTGGFGLVGVITELCKRVGVAQHNTDFMVKCGRNVNPAMIERVTRPRFSRLQIGRGPQNDVKEEEPPIELTQFQKMPAPELPRADPWIDQHLGHLVRKNEFIMSALIHLQLINSHFYNYQVGMVDQINVMAASMNINDRVQPPQDLPTFEAQPPKNPFNEEWSDEE